MSSEKVQAIDPDSAEEMIDWIARRLECGEANARIIFKMYYAQHRLSEFHRRFSARRKSVRATRGNRKRDLADEKQTTQEVRNRWLARARHYFFHCLIGRNGNEALSRAFALRLSRLRGGNAVATPDDYGFVLTVTPAQVFTAEELPALLSPENFTNDLHEALSRSDLLKYHRNAAQTGMMVYRNISVNKNPCANSSGRAK